MRCSLLFVGMSALLPLSPPSLAQEPAAIDWQTCRAQVLPDTDALAWRAIPWLAELRAGVAAGAAQRKPVLLWAMNGHPLGCT